MYYKAQLLRSQGLLSGQVSCRCGTAQIRSWRTQTGMTLRQFARAAGTSPSRLSDYENAKVAPTTDVLARLNHVAATHAHR
jgi:DNA-binding transcriptional regulator YiaG